MGSVASPVLHFFFNAAVASALVELTHGMPMSSEIPSQMTTEGPPHGLVTLKFLKRIFSQTAFGLQVSLPTAVPYLPEEEPVKFSNKMLVMLTREG